jgi:hypothetical protein
MHAGICYKLFLDVHGDAVSLYACSDFFFVRISAQLCHVVQSFLFFLFACRSPWIKELVGEICMRFAWR